MCGCKIFACGNFLTYGKLPWSWKKLCLWKPSSINEKSLLAENFFDRGEIFLDHRKVSACGKRPWSRKCLACGKRPWFWKNLCLWKFFLIMEKSLLVETFFDCGKVFPWGKHLDQEKYLLVENFLNRGKVFWKWSYLIKQVLILKPLRYVFLNLKQKLNLLTFLLMEKE